MILQTVWRAAQKNSWGGCINPPLHWRGLTLAGNRGEGWCNATPLAVFQEYLFCLRVEWHQFFFSLPTILFTLPLKISRLWPHDIWPKTSQLGSCQAENAFRGTSFHMSARPTQVNWGQMRSMTFVDFFKFYCFLRQFEALMSNQTIILHWWLEMRSWNHQVIKGQRRHMTRKWFFWFLTPKNNS